MYLTRIDVVLVFVRRRSKSRCRASDDICRLSHLSSVSSFMIVTSAIRKKDG